MAESATFTHVCDALERATSLSRIEARGTVRLALKSAGLAADSVTADQMEVVLERVLPHELESRGVADFAGVCQTITRGLGAMSEEESTETPESVFSRLGGS